MSRKNPAQASVTRPSTHGGGAARQTLITNVAIALLGLLTGVLAARILGPDGRGDLAAIQLWPTLLAILATLGMHEALAYFAAKETGRVSVYVTSAVAVALAASGLFFVVGWLIVPLVLHNYPPDIVADGQRYLLLIPLYALVLLPCHALRGMSEFGWWNVLRVAPSVAWLGVLLVAAGLGRASAGELADGNLVGLAVVGFGVAVVIRWKVRGSYRLGARESRLLLGFGIPAAGAVVPQLLNLRVDQLVMASVLSAQDLGLYVVAVAWSSAVNPALFAIGMVLLPKVAGAVDEQERRRILVRTVRVGVWAAMATVALVAACTPVAFRLVLPVAFHEAIPAAVILVVASGLFGCSFILAEGVRGLGKPAVTLYAELAGLAVTILTLTVLLRRLAILGAAVSSVAGYGAVVIGLLLYLRHTVPELRGNVLTWSAAREAFRACLDLAKRHPVES